MTATDRVAVVTGATGGIGSAIAVDMLRRGLTVVTIVRDPDRATTLESVVAGIGGRGSVTVIPGDLSSRAGVADAAREIAHRHSIVHVLVNNAGAHFDSHRLTVDGVERHVAVDYLAAYGLTTLLEPQLRAGRARIVNVVSDTLRDTRRIKLLGPPRPATLNLYDLDDLTRLNPAAGFDAFEAYARAKLLTVSAGFELASRLAGIVTVNAVHPGIVATDIVDNVTPPLLKPLRRVIRSTMLTPEEGAASALWLSLDPALDTVTGRYFVRTVETPAPLIAYRDDVQQRLRGASDRFFEAAR